MHILPKGFTKTRRYGGFSGAKCEAYLQLCTKLRNIQPEEVKLTAGDSQTEREPLKCSRCNCELNLLSYTARPSWRIVFERIYIDVNLYGVMNCCRAVIEGMCTRGFGRVITISSGAGQAGLAMGVSAYAAGKGGQIAFMRHLALENARAGVTANTLALGLMSNAGGSEVTAALAKTVPTGRLGTPEDVGAACVFLASNEASWLTGQTIGLNGGNLTS